MKLDDVQFELHTHSLVSQHAYSTINELAKAASDKHLIALGISEHGPLIHDGASEIHFINYPVLPKKLFGVEMLYGVELNCMDYEGTIDMKEELLKKMDIRLCGLHSPAYVSGTVEQNTRAVLKLCKNKYIDCITHPDDSRYAIEYEPFVKLAKETDTLIEVNNNSLRATWKENVRENVLTYLKLCKKYDNKIIMASDAHYSGDIKNLQLCINIIEEVGINPKNIMNYDYEMFKEFIKNKRSKE